MQHHALPTKFVILLFFCLLLAFILYLGYKAPSNQNNACLLLSGNPDWYEATINTQKKWGVPISVQLAIIKQESHFRANVAPPHKKLLGFIPWSRISSAHGYMQALNSTWQQYLNATHRHSARRSSFANATDFIGWYVNDAHLNLGIPKNNAYLLYLVYHEGAHSYHLKSYKKKPWLMHIARTVEKQANMYHHQLIRCKSKLRVGL